MLSLADVALKDEPCCCAMRGTVRRRLHCGHCHASSSMIHGTLMAYLVIGNGLGIVHAGTDHETADHYAAACAEGAVIVPLPVMSVYPSHLTADDALPVAVAEPFSGPVSDELPVRDPGVTLQAVQGLTGPLDGADTPRTWVPVVVDSDGVRSDPA